MSHRGESVSGDGRDKPRQRLDKGNLVTARQLCIRRQRACVAGDKIKKKKKKHSIISFGCEVKIGKNHNLDTNPVAGG